MSLSISGNGLSHSSVNNTTPYNSRAGAQVAAVKKPCSSREEAGGQRPLSTFDGSGLMEKTYNSLSSLFEKGSLVLQSGGEAPKCETVNMEEEKSRKKATLTYGHWDLGLEAGENSEFMKALGSQYENLQLEKREQAVDDVRGFAYVLNEDGSKTLNARFDIRIFARDERKANKPQFIATEEDIEAQFRQFSKWIDEMEAEYTKANKDGTVYNNGEDYFDSLRLELEDSRKAKLTELKDLNERFERLKAKKAEQDAAKEAEKDEKALQRKDLEEEATYAQWESSVAELSKDVLRTLLEENGGVAPSDLITGLYLDSTKGQFVDLLSYYEGNYEQENEF